MKMVGKKLFYPLVTRESYKGICRMRETTTIRATNELGEIARSVDASKYSFKGTMMRMFVFYRRYLW